MRVVFDVNILISYGIGKRLSELGQYITNKKIETYYNDELIDEYVTVVSRPAIRQLISEEKIKNTLLLLHKHAKFSSFHHRRISIYPKITDPNADIGDLYLLKLCADVKANFLVTGDKWLLKLTKYADTEIITFKKFKEVLG